MASWPVASIREKFSTQIEIRGYKELLPNPMVIVQGDTPNIDTYLNQFTRRVDDTPQIDNRRKSFFSLRCINLVEDDGVMMRNFHNDSYHSCSEVLGTWASGECKQEAIEFTWRLLTQTFQLPQNKIYIRYFDGNKESQLDPDYESFKMWKKYIPEERILPYNSQTDFWSAGDIGPCGPSVVVMFDVDDRFIDIWRLVFVQFNKQEDSVLRPLDAKHVITGLNVESLAFILQKKMNPYDSDVFKDILGVIQFGAGDGTAKYSGRVGIEDNNQVDAAYRLIADHMRTVSAVTCYCAEHELSSELRENLLKHADRRAVVFGHKILDTKLDHYQLVVNAAVRNSGFYPTQMDSEKISSVIDNEKKIYQKIRAKDKQALLLRGWNPAMTNTDLLQSLPKRKTNKLPKNRRGKQQEQKRPPQLPLASIKNEDDSAQVPEDEDGAAQLCENEDGIAEPPSVENEDNKLDEIDGPTNIGGPEMGMGGSPKSVEVYRMRLVHFLGGYTHIIHQDKNGPCPLISICNCLLLTGMIRFDHHLTEVAMEHLVHIVQDLVKKHLIKKACSTFAEGSILDVVPTLAEGLDVDVKFNRTHGFSATPGTMVFECLEIPLCHGWFADEEEMAGASSYSFETLSLAVREPHFLNVERTKDFLDGPQLTAHGLACLYRDVPEDVPSVHYWNKHFSTIIKYNGELYTLVTDEGYLETNVVWQTLNDINGGGSYMSGDFTPIDLELGATQSGEKNPAPLGSIDDKFILEPGNDFSVQKASFPAGTPLDVASTRIGRVEKKPSAPLGSVREIYFKRPTGDGISLDKFILEPGNEFSVRRTLVAAGTSLDVADTTRTGRVVALDILKDLIRAHSTGCSYNGEYELSSIFLYNGHATIRAPFFNGRCTDATMAKDFETYIAKILEQFRIDKVGLPAFFTELTNLLKRRLSSFIHRRYFWDCALTTLALKSPLSRSGLFTGLQRIRRFAPPDVQRSLYAVLKHNHDRSDWRKHILEKGHPLLKKVLLYNPDKSVVGGEYGRYHGNLSSLSIFPRQVNEHGMDKMKDDGSKQDVGEEKDEGRKKELGEEFQTTNTCEGKKQEVEEEEEPLELLSDLDLLYSHYLELWLPLVLERLLTSPYMSQALWKWVREILREYDKPEALDPAAWDR